MIVWMIGLSGAGKTTIGREVWRQWRERESNVVMLDGDEIRDVIGRDASVDPYSIEGRRRNADRITALCELLDRQGMHVVCCILSIFPEMRDANRARFGDYLEVHVATSFEVCAARDVKGIYAPALRGETRNVVGIDIAWVPPAHPDVVLENHFADHDVSALAEQVLAAVWARRAGTAEAARVARAVEELGRGL